MKRCSTTVFFGLGLLLLGSAANAQPGYQSGYGYGRNSGSLIRQVMSDLNGAASNARLDGHERGHFDQAMQKLQEFEGRWSQGNFDTGKLDKAIESLDHLANADRIHPRDRDLLSRDLAALREF